jgi:hypothetical protein
LGVANGLSNDRPAGQKGAVNLEKNVAIYKRCSAGMVQDHLAESGICRSFDDSYFYILRTVRDVSIFGRQSDGIAGRLDFLKGR